MRIFPFPRDSTLEKGISLLDDQNSLSFFNFSKREIPFSRVESPGKGKILLSDKNFLTEIPHIKIDFISGSVSTYN